MTTIVECKLIREGGSFPEVGGVTYHFAPNAEGAHVCAIENDDHADVFLATTEGYRLYRGAAKAGAPATKPLEAVAPVIVTEPEQSDENVVTLGAVEAEVQLPVANEKSPAEVRAELAAEFERLYGEAPHPRTGIEKLRKLIAEKQTV